MTPVAPFYHGTTAILAAGAVIVPPAVRCPENPASAQAHPVVEGTIRSDPDACYMTEYRREWQLPLRHIKRGGHFAQRPIMNARDAFVRGVTHCGVIAVEIQCAHWRQIILRRWPRPKGPAGRLLRG